MRCNKCHKNTMLPMGDPSQRSVPYTCAYCGFTFTPLRLTPAQFKVWNEQSTRIVKQAEEAAEVEFERMARNLRDKGHPEPEALND